MSRGLLCLWALFLRASYNHISLLSRQTEAAAYPVLPDRDGEKKLKESEASIMQKNIRQNHPCREGRGLWVQFSLTSKKGLWRSFSNRREGIYLRWAEPVYVSQTIGLSTARGSRTAPAIVAGYSGRCLPSRGFPSVFSKSVRSLTEHKKTK